MTQPASLDIHLDDFLVNNRPLPIRSLVTELFHRIWDTWDFLSSSLHFASLQLKFKGRKFTYNGANPSSVFEKNSSPILLLHGVKSDQSSWSELIDVLQKNGKGPIFTVNIDYDKEDFTQKISKKFQEIQQLYEDQGVHEVKLQVGGHSRGAIEVAYYAFVDKCPDIPTGMTIEKIISVAGRLRITGREKYPSFFEDIKDKVSQLFPAILSKGENDPKIYTISAENDSLIPVGGSSIINENGYLARDCGHLSILRSKEMWKIFNALV